MKLIDVDPVLPTKASTRSRLVTDRAVMYAKVRMKVVIIANRRSDIGAVLPWSPAGDGGSNGAAVRPLFDELRLGRHFKTASSEARHG